MKSRDQYENEKHNTESTNRVETKGRSELKHTQKTWQQGLVAKRKIAIKQKLDNKPKLRISLSESSDPGLTFHCNFPATGPIYKPVWE